MKALQYKEYGGTEVLQWNEISVPAPGANEVLILVKAASLNPTDTKIRMGYIKFPGADHFPKSMGMDFAGVVAKIGESVTHVKEGDKVMGYTGAHGGSFADVVIASAENTFLIPGDLGYAAATTLPMNAATALKVVNTYLKPVTGKSILINGASGGIGLFIVQYCKMAGAIVSGTASGEESVSILRKLDIDEVIDYRQTDILQSGKKWDAILDTSGKLDFEQAKILLNDNGEFSTMVPHGEFGEPGRIDGSKKENPVFAVPGPEEFAASQKLAGEGKIQIFVGKKFPMKDAISVIEQFESGKLNVTGKVVMVNE